MKKRRAVFFDRDGVIVSTVLRNGKPTAPWKRDEFQIKDDAQQVLSLIGSLGYLCILITNQPDMAYGHVLPEEWRWMQSCTEKLPFDDVFIAELIVVGNDFAPQITCNDVNGWVLTGCSAQHKVELRRGIMMNS